MGVANLQGRWNFDSANAKDSSGKTRHGTTRKLFSPSDLSNLYTWYDASELTTAPTTLADKSSNGYNLTKYHTPTITTNAQNGLNVLTFDSDGTSINQYYEGNIVGQNINQTWSIFIQTSNWP